MMLQPRISSTCDECKSRKVRCLRESDLDTHCNNCKKRGGLCHYSANKRRARQRLPLRTSQTSLEGVPGQPTSTVLSTPPGDARPRRTTPAPSDIIEGATVPSNRHQQDTYHVQLYVDQLLEDTTATERRRNEESPVKAHNQYVGSSGIAFFSDRKISPISDRLGHGKLRSLFELLSSSINSRMNRTSQSSVNVIGFHHLSSPLQIPEESAMLYIATYFEHIHPVYPFINRHEFEDKAFHSDSARCLHDSPPFSALYHTVLALGSQHHGGGSFEPGKGIAWQLYQTALGLFPEIIIPREALLNVQAVTAMAIFARNSSCVQIGDFLTAEAARMAQALGLNKGMGDNSNLAASHRVFWVIYILEKTMSFACGKASILTDSDIGTPVPETPESVLAGFNLFHTMCRFSRLISKTYDALFSISATLLPPDRIQAAIDRSNFDLESWRMSIPESLRPGNPSGSLQSLDRKSMAIALRIHFHYYSIVIALTRLSLSLPHIETSEYVATKSESLLNACSSVIELTKFIDTATYTPIWSLLSVPLSALFILFDFVVHNPSHYRTANNLSLLGIAGGYFCTLEYASQGALQTSLLSDIAYMARNYVSYTDRDNIVTTPAAMPATSGVQPPSASRTEPHTPLSIIGASTTIDEMFAEHAGLGYPTDGILYPMGYTSLDGIDLMEFFTTTLPDGSQLGH